MSEVLQNSHECPFNEKRSGDTCPLGHVPPSYTVPSAVNDYGYPLVPAGKYIDDICYNANGGFGKDYVEGIVAERALPSATSSVHARDYDLLPKNRRNWHYCPYILDKIKYDGYKIEDSQKSNVGSGKTSDGGKKGGCYVATCVYGSYDSPEVWTLRLFRDNTLSKSWYGKTFILFYYAVSPCIVKLFGKMKWFNNFCKPILNKIVNKVQNQEEKI